jgi:hypothetical protein
MTRLLGEVCGFFTAVAASHFTERFGRRIVVGIE